MNEVYLGIDIGSVSTNIVTVDAIDTKKVYDTFYIRTNGQPLAAVRDGLSRLSDKGYTDENIKGVGVTGSARLLIGNVLGADIVRNEITAHAVAAINQHPEVRTVLEIGGQDSKIITIKDGLVTDFAMNTICAAGTGSFLDQQSNRLDMGIEEFSKTALESSSPVRIAGRCTVFAESDMIHKQQLGYEKKDIIAGLCEALVRNYLNNVAKGKELAPPILFQGGVAFNSGIIHAFEKELGEKLTIPDHFNVMGALGIAILVKEFNGTGGNTNFRGFELSQQKISLKPLYCDECANNCELTQASSEEKVLSIWGDRCGKWQN